MNLPAVAIIPAHNEAPRLLAVLDPVVESGVFSRVLVVDDGSTDNTADVAWAIGSVSVMELSPNRGKGGAMLAGVAATTEPVVAFFDADLVGLTARQVAELVAPVREGLAGMTVGLMDYGIYNNVQTALPLISGQRAIRRDVLSRIPAALWDGFKIEAALNEAALVSGVPVEAMILNGVGQVPKWQKVGVRRGISDGVKMLVNVLRATRDVRGQIR